MKYGESTFDILYLLFAIAGGCLILAFLLETLRDGPAEGKAG